MSNEIEIENIRKNRPVNSHFHPDKGSKYDVEVDYDERHPHVADRLGHSKVQMTPLESLLRLDKLITHPTFLNQPFIQTPKAEPNEDICFEKGEVIYEAPKVKEWT